MTKKENIKRSRRKDSAPNPVDVHVGQRLRQLRTLKGLSQGKLGESVGITFQQVQKYESGMNRVGASRLYDLSKVLDVPVSSFFEGVGQALQDQNPSSPAYQVAEPAADDYEADPFTKRETLELIRSYYKIKDPNLRKTVMDLAKSLAKKSGT